MTNTVVYESKTINLFCYVNDIDFVTILGAKQEFYNCYNITKATKSFLTIRMNECSKIQMAWILNKPFITLVSLCDMKIVVDDTVKNGCGIIEYNNLFDSIDNVTQ